MTTIKLGDKRLIVEDGCHVEMDVSGEEIRVRPAAPATPIAVPPIQWTPPAQSWPLVPAPSPPWPMYPNTTTTGPNIISTIPWYLT